MKALDFDCLIIAVKDKKAVEKIKEGLILEDGVEASKIIWEKPQSICSVRRR